MNKRVESLNKDNLADKVTSILRRRIMDLELSSGERVDVGSIAEEFDVSKAPIRDAMKTLEDRGLIEVRPRVGYFVVELSKQDIKEIYDMRELLEVYAVQQSYESIPLNKVQSILEKTRYMKNNNIPQDELRKRFDKTDETLHQELIIGYAENRFLRNFTNRIHDLIGLTRHLNKRIPRALEEHIEIFQGLLGRNPDKAGMALKKHLNRVRKETIKSIEQNYQN